MSNKKTYFLTVKVKVWTLAIAPLTWVRLVTNSALQSQKWQLIGTSQCCRSALCGHPLPALTDNWTHGAASKHTIAPISHTRPSPRSRSYYSFPVPLRVWGWVGLNTQQFSNLLKVACSGPGVSRTRNLLVTSPILYQLDHCTHSKQYLYHNLQSSCWGCCWSMNDFDLLIRAFNRKIFINRLIEQDVD